jgi:hypothetical protein
LITNKNKLYPSCKIRGAYHKENGLEAESVCNAEKGIPEPILTLDKNNETDCRIVTSLFNTWSACSSINAH